MGEHPAYRDLPDGRALGIWGPDDRFGCLNHLTPERTAHAATLVQTGETFSLNAPLSYPNPYPFGGASRRRAPTHVIIHTHYGRDDYLDGLYPQATSQWDHFLHVRDLDNDCFYNATTDETVGVDAWAARGISGRGVLLDLGRWREQRGEAIDWRARDTASAEDLLRCATDQGVAISPGTILVLRFGWETGFAACSYRERVAITEREFVSPGLEPSRETVAWLWDEGIAAVAADNIALEAFPPQGGYFMHIDLLARIGLPIGELWHVDELAAACARVGRYEFLLTSAPLHVAGGIGSTANALAIL